MSSLLIAEAVIVGLVTPLIVWLTVRGRKHLNRAGAWGMAATSFVLVVRHLLAVFDPQVAPTETALLLRALTLAGSGICCGSLVGWLYRTRDQAKHAT
jgi:hypothetical protein